jgi:replicative DNA helicase
LGKLGHWGRKKINLDITTLTENKNKMWFFKGTLASGLDDIIIAIQELKPDVVYTDCTYLLNKKGYYQSKWERVAAVAEELKKIASHFQIPVIETFQFNRKGSGSLDNIGGSDTVAQLASIALGLDDDEDEVANFSSSQYKRLELLKGREGEKGMVRMIFDMKKAIIAQDSVIYGEVQDEGE